MRFFATIAILMLLVGCTGSTDVTPAKKVDEAQKDTAYQKEMDELRKSIKSEVKIK